MFPNSGAKYLGSQCHRLALIGGTLAVFSHCHPSVYPNHLFLGLPSDWIKALPKDLLLTLPPL